MTIQKGGVIVVAPGGEDIHQFQHQTRSKEGKGTQLIAHVEFALNSCQIRMDSLVTSVRDGFILNAPNSQNMNSIFYVIHPEPD